MREGINKPFMISSAVIWPPIQSMVVVTSPIGVQAPPALAAITIIPAKNKRSSLCSRSFFIRETITIVVVRLSKIALRKNETKPTIHIKVESFLVLILEVITSKPLCASTTSTIVIAPIKKNTICAVVMSDSLSCSPTKCASLWESAYKVHKSPAPNKAEADLLIRSGCSSAIAA